MHLQGTQHNLEVHAYMVADCSLGTLLQAGRGLHVVLTGNSRLAANTLQHLQSQLLRAAVCGIGLQQLTE